MTTIKKIVWLKVAATTNMIENMMSTKKSI